MISVYQLKPKFIQLLRPLAQRCYNAGLTANHITVQACVLSLAYGALLALWPACSALWWGLPLFLFARMALNAIDGMLARDFGQKSRLGAQLNEMGDVLADAALFIPFALLPGVSGWWVAGFVWLALLTEYAGVLGCLLGQPRQYQGPMGKSDRAVLIGALALWVAASQHWPSLLQATVVQWALALGCVLMLPCTLNRLNAARRAANGGNA